jgi:hypothetical protein
MSTPPTSPAPRPAPVDPIARVRRRLGRRAPGRLAAVVLVATVLAVWAFWWFLSAHVTAMWHLQVNGARVRWDPFDDWRHGGATVVSFNPAGGWPAESSLTDEGLKPLARVLGVESLDLSRCPRLTDDGLAVLRSQPRLRILALTMTPPAGGSRPRLTDGVTAHLAAVPSLEDLALEGLPITDAGVARLGGLPRLKYLDLSATRVTDVTLALLANAAAFPALEEVNLERTGVSNDGVAGLAARRPALMILHPAVEPPAPPGLEGP